MLTDTHPEAEAVRQELLRQKTPAEKFALVRALTATVVSLCKQGIRERHPEFSDREVDLCFVEMNYGRELAEGMRRFLEERDALSPDGVVAISRAVEERSDDTPGYGASHVPTP